VSLILLAILFGILQLAAGIVIGCCLPVRLGRRGADRADARYLRNLAQRLHEVIAGLAGDVDEHQSRIQQVNRELADTGQDDSGKLTHTILESVATVLRLNERLETQLTDAERKLQRQADQIQTHLNEARTDPLTELPNRRAFDDEMARLIARRRRKRAPFALILIDVDHFKQFNDRMGHPAGDQVLKQIARALAQQARREDLVARVGGEEFAVLVPDELAEGACLAAERIRQKVETLPLVLSENRVQVTISLGVAVMATEKDAAALIAHADAALYASKAAGRNCTHLYAPAGCRRVDPAGEPLGGEAEAGISPSAGDDEEMVVVCEDLRRRLSEIADQADP